MISGTQLSKIAKLKPLILRGQFGSGRGSTSASSSQLHLKSEQQQSDFVMSYQEAYNLVKETYSGSMKITEDCFITDWQAVKHIYHAEGLNINPEDFNITQAELLKIRTDGFITYVRRGNQLPSLEHVKRYEQALKDICQDSATEQRDNSKYYDINGIRPATTFRNGRDLVSFDQNTGDLITGFKHRADAIKQFKQTNQLGGQEWIDKWSKK